MPGGKTSARRFLRNILGRGSNGDANSASASAQQEAVSGSGPTTEQPAVPGTSDTNTVAPVVDADVPTRIPEAAARPKAGKLGLEILYEPPEARNPVVDIIFVHGLTGSSYDTWLYSSRTTKTHWPSDLLKAEIPDARLLSFGYDADVVGWWSPASNNRIGNHAENLLGRVTRLKERTSSEDRSVIFVMHSLGGLVVQNALDLSRSSPDPHLRKLEQATIGLVFLGTPHFGSDKAKWAGYSAAMLNVVKKTNKAIVQVLEPDSEMLSTIQKRFHEVLRLRQANDKAISITCFYEELSLPVLGTIVDAKSALLPGYSGYGIHANHMDMCKFKDSENQSYQDVSGEVLRWVKSAREKATEMSVLQEECLRSLYFSGLESREEAVKDPLPGTFSWIWDPTKCEFPAWLEKGRGIFWIQGRASSGKSTMMKYIERTAPSLQQQLRNLSSTKPPRIVSHFIDGKCLHPFAQSLEGIARTFLWKLLRQDQRFFQFVLPKYLELKRDRPAMEWKPSILRDLLAEILCHQKFCPLWLFLDGLDEYPGDLLDIADGCNMMMSVASCLVRICVSSRPDRELACTISPSFGVHTVVLKLENHTCGDITTLAEHEIRRTSDILSEAERDELISQLSRRADGLFMWVRLASRDIVRSCIQGADYDNLVSRLDLLPREVNELYHEILQKRTTQPYKGEGLLFLGLVVFGKRSFSLLEFSFILAGSVRYREGDAEASLSRKVDFYTGGLADCRTGRVVVSHGTVASFIHGLESTEQPPSPQFAQARQKLARTCLLLLRAFEQPRGTAPGHGAVCSTLVPGLTENDGYRLRGLRTYAVHHWLDHWRSVRRISDSPDLVYRKGMVETNPVSGNEITHWRQIHLARCWEQPTLMERDDHVVKTCLGFMLLLVIPLRIFSPPPENRIIQAAGCEGEVLGVTPLLQLDHTERWRWKTTRADLDFLISVDFAPGYSVSFHARQMLKSQLGVVDCIAGSPGTTVMRKDNGGHSNWFELFLDDPLGMRTVNNPIRLRRCRESDFSELPLTKVGVQVRPSLLNQIKVVLWHYIQLEATRVAAYTPNADDRNQVEAADLQFATPMHYAAFNGLDSVVEQLDRFGANLDYVSPESRYGSSLMAAIFGLSEGRYGSTGRISTIETLIRLDKTRKVLDTPANAGSLGKMVTPIQAAVRLYTAYKKRTGLDSEDLSEMIRFFVNEGAQVDAKVRAAAESIVGLKRYFSDAPYRTALSSWASQFASTPPIPIPKSFSDVSRRPGNFTIGGLGPLDSISHGQPGRGAQTFEGGFL